ncbi:MAG: response regulator [Anaerolineae bacterium]|nr:response regulator [Anaerolineae bacterium]
MISKELFADYVRDALGGFYDPVHLQTHPLAALLLPDHEEENRGQALRQLLLEAIESLRPEGGIPFGRPEWQGYRVLWLRYVESLPREEICQELGIGRTSFYRQLQRALEAVVSLLWARYRRGQRGEAREQQPGMSSQQVRNEVVHLVRSSSREWVNLREVLDRVLETVQPLIEQRGVRLLLQAPEELPPTHGDPAILRQIILNVLTETLRFVEGGELYLRITVEGRRSSWCLSKLAQAAEITRSDGVEVAQSLLQAYGGKLWFVYEGQGAPALCFSLPVSVPKSILVIDDNPDAIELYRRYFPAREYVLLFARNAREAWKHLEASLPDLILLDVLMPREDGWEILQRLKLMPRTAHIPVVICSVLSQPQLALTLGAAAVLQKPVEPERLLSEVRALLQGTED